MKKKKKELLVANQEKKRQADELVIVNKELLTTNATKDKFFSIIAHDLKSPFNSIIGFSSLLKEQVRKKNYKAIDKYAAIIEQSSNRAMDLLLNLMEWAKSQTGRMEFNPEYIELEVLINETVTLYDAIAKQKQIKIKVSKSFRNQILFADKAMITTVLRNLFSNAIKFTHKKGEIIISTEKKQGQLTVTVQDNGVGISNENIQKIFRIDTNYTSTGTNKEKGTGLGLILCKEFIDKHKGHIWADSEEGEGTSVSFTLPDNIAEAEDQVHITSSEENENKDDKQQIPGLKILIAEDDEISQEFISIIVEEFSKEIIMVQTGTEALETCRNHHDIDLILMDINMPEMNGLDATKHIRTFNKEVIIIAQTAYSRSSDRDNALKAGCNSYIPKPINKDNLIEIIQSYFK